MRKHGKVLSGIGLLLALVGVYLASLFVSSTQAQFRDVSTGGQSISSAGVFPTPTPTPGP